MYGIQWQGHDYNFEVSGMGICISWASSEFERPLIVPMLLLQEFFLFVPSLAAHISFEQTLPGF